MCRKFLAVLLIILFFFLFTPILYFHNIKLVFLKPALYQGLIKSGRLTESLSNFLSSTLTSSIQKGAAKEGIPASTFSSENFKEIIKKAFPQEWTERELGGIVDNFFTWFYGDTEELNLKISLKEIKKNFGPAFGEFFSETAKGIPTCTSAQIQKLAQGDQNTVCLPPGMSAKDLQQFKGSQELENLLAGLPDEVDLLNLGSKEGKPKDLAAPMASLNKFRDYAHLAFLILYIATAGLVLLLIFIALLTWKPFSSILKTLGTTILIPSALILVTSLFSLIFSRAIKLSQILSLAGFGNLQSGFDPTMFDSLGAFFSDLISHFTLYKIIECGTLLAISICLIVVGAVLRKKKTI